MPRSHLLTLAATMLLLGHAPSIAAAGFQHGGGGGSSNRSIHPRRNKTSRAQMRKTQQGVLPDTKLTHLQNRGVRLKDTPAQQNSKRDLGSLQVNTEQGTVKGFIPQYEVQPTNDWYGVRAWLGLAYAAPPVGQLRFAPPHPPSPYGATYKAYTEKPMCPQFAYQSIFTNEDCLYLDVWAPRTKPDLTVYPNGYPVVVNLHGGAYIILSSNFDGTPFAKKDTVVVNINFRLGVFGALVSPDGTTFKGNQHLLDQIQALEWVKKNIRNFDG